MGRKKLLPVSMPAETASNGGVVKTKADAVRAAVATGLSSPTEISEFIKTTYGLEISAGTVSAYKSADKAKGKKPPKASVPASGAVKPLGNVDGKDILVQLELIKSLVKDFGAGQVKRMIDLFA